MAAFIVGLIGYGFALFFAINGICNWIFVAADFKARGLSDLERIGWGTVFCVFAVVLAVGTNKFIAVVL